MTGEARAMQFTSIKIKLTSRLTSQLTEPRDPKTRDPETRDPKVASVQEAGVQEAKVQEARSQKARVQKAGVQEPDRQALINDSRKFFIHKINI